MSISGSQPQTGSFYSPAKAGLGTAHRCKSSAPAARGNTLEMGYNGIMNELRGISPKTLADTLKQLNDAGIVNREAFNEIPPRVEYSLTKDGHKLRDAIIPLVNWAVDRSSHKDCIILQSVLKKKLTAK